MFGFNFLSLLAPTPQPSQSEADGKRQGEFSPPVGHATVESGALCQAVPGPSLTPAGPGRILLGFVEPVRGEPAPVAKAKPRRARGKRTSEGGRNLAVMRAVAAACCRSRNGASLKAVAQVYGASIGYVRAASHLRRANPALLNAAVLNDVPLLTAAYKTAVATDLVVVTD